MRHDSVVSVLVEQLVDEGFERRSQVPDQALFRLVSERETALSSISLSAPEHLREHDSLGVRQFDTDVSGGDLPGVHQRTVTFTCD